MDQNPNHFRIIGSLGYYPRSQNPEQNRQLIRINHNQGHNQVTSNLTEMYVKPFELHRQNHTNMYRQRVPSSNFVSESKYL